MTALARSPRKTIAALAALIVVLVAPSPALAAETYTSSAIPCNNKWGGGQSDAAGTVYIACSTKILRYRLDGTKLADITLPGYSYDVAPSPDGAFLYITIDSYITRMVRAQDGSYAQDPTWKLDAYTLAAQPWTPRGRFVATDDWGDIYVSNGGWVIGQPNIVLKYSAAGRLKTLFGAFGNGVGEFNVNFGLAVTRDGRSIYTVEQTNGRVQRFDYAPDGTYRFALTWGRNDPQSDCTAPDFGAPYDVGLDPWGFVYVMDTTCRRVQKFDAVGTWRAVAGTVSNISHGVAVDWHGGFFVGQSNARFQRTAANPEPGPVPGIAPLPAPDTTAPTVTGVTVADPTFSRTVDLAITATDNISVTEVRVANEDGAWGAWRPFASPLAHTLTDGYGAKTVTVQVRDAGGLESNAIARATTYRNSDLTAPSLVSTTLPATTTTQTVTVGIEATDNVAVTQVRLANEDGVWSPWTTHAALVQWTLSAGYATKGVSAQVRDLAGNESNVVYRTIVFQMADAPPPGPVDVAAPVMSSATVPALTSTRDVTIAIEATDDVAVTRVRLANEDGNWGAWKAFAPLTAHTLSDGFGAKAVFVQVGDAAGRESTTAVLRTSYQADAPPPGGGGGAPDAQAPVLVTATLPAATTSQLVTVAVDATDNIAVAQVRLANEDGVWTGWTAHAAQVQWTLSATFGPKAVFVQVRDAAGNESNVALARTSYQANAPGPADAADPVLRALTVPDPALAREILVTLDAADDIGVTQVRLANEDGAWGEWQAFAAEVPWTLTAGNTYKVVFAQVRDAAGRESNVLTARTLLQLA